MVTSVDTFSADTLTFGPKLATQRSPTSEIERAGVRKVNPTGSWPHAFWVSLLRGMRQRQEPIDPRGVRVIAARLNCSLEDLVQQVAPGTALHDFMSVR